jgi:hypothetical protein
MKRTVVLVLSVIALCCIVAAALADDPKKTVGTSTTAATAQAPVATQPAPIVKFACVVQGTPVEFPDDIYITNKGTTTAVKGTKLHWEIPNTGRMGDYTLAADLPAGSGVMVSGVVGGGFTAGTQCTITVKKTTMTAVPREAVKKPVAVPIVKFGCVVQGTPVEFPNDIYVTNTGTASVPKGTVVHWELPNVSLKGDYTLAADLAVGKGVMIDGVAGAGLPAGTACTATKK